MSGKGNTHLTFDGELTWAEFKKVVNLAGRGIPDTAMVTLTNNGSDTHHTAQTVIVDWELSALDESSKGILQGGSVVGGQIRSGA